MMASRWPRPMARISDMVPPRWRMFRPTRRLASGRVFEASMAFWRLRTAISPKPSMPWMTSQSIV